MAKKVLWQDNTVPPTNYLWLRMDAKGKIMGLYEHNGLTWVKIAGENKFPSDNPTSGSCDGCVQTSETPNSVYVTDLSGKQITINYSQAPVPDTIVQRTSTGSIKSAKPQDSDEVVVREMLEWING